jgi:hypothetical protein
VLLTIELDFSSDEMKEDISLNINGMKL